MRGRGRPRKNQPQDYDSSNENEENYRNNGVVSQDQEDDERNSHDESD